MVDRMTFIAEYYYNLCGFKLNPRIITDATKILVTTTSDLTNTKMKLHDTSVELKGITITSKHVPRDFNTNFDWDRYDQCVVGHCQRTFCSPYERFGGRKDANPSHQNGLAR